MIAVLADDLTGASELGGLALRYNLRVEVTTGTDLNTQADVLIIAADTRSMNEQQAIAKVDRLTRDLLALKPTLIFKKIDSILRGHVLAEIKSQLKAMNLKKALLIPANPTLHRTIANGMYFFHGRPIHESSFSYDPEFPIKSSAIRDMLRAGSQTIHVVKLGQAIPSEGITVGEVEDNQDLKAWATVVDKETTLIAGASGFFLAWLDTISLPTHNLSVYNHSQGHPVLLVSGTTFSKSHLFIKNNMALVNYMPNEIMDSENPSEEQYEQWATAICATLSQHRKAIIAINPESTISQKRLSPQDLRQKTAYVVKKVFHRTMIPELVLEGGSTAAAVLSELKISRFHPTAEMAPGVVRMHVDPRCIPAGMTSNLNITFKPGSYDWPTGTWAFH